jgi:translation initiation factor IF-3
LEIKAKKAKGFLEDGDKVKVVLTMKGRELSRREDSKKSFYQFLNIMLDSGVAAFDCAQRDEEKKCYVIFK